MKIERTKNAVRNLKWGLLNKIVGLILPFICRAAIIRIFGMNYLGLNSLFTSILSTLSLAELGFGSAVVFFMYRAVAEDDQEKVGALMYYYKKVYRVVGIVIFVCGLMLVPFLHIFIKKDIPDNINIYIIYLLTLSGTAVSYFLFAYKNCILEAYQRKDIIVNVNTVTQLLERIFQLFFIFVAKNYYLYLIATIITNVANNIITAVIVRIKYPHYIAKGKLKREDKKEIENKIKGLFLYKVGNVVTGSADNIIISAFLGLVIMGRYGNYYYVISTLFAFLGIYYSSIRAGLGNSMVMETPEKNYKDYCVLQFIQNWIIGWRMVCLLCLFQDYIVIYAGSVNQLEMGLVISICFYFYVWKIQDVVHVYKEAGGMWNADKLRPLIGAIANLLLNFVLVQFIGLYGVIISTILVLVFVDVPWSSKVLFDEYFKVGRIEYYKKLLIGVLDMFIMCIPTYFACTLVRTDKIILNMVIKLLVCIVLPNMLFILRNYNKLELKEVKMKVKSVLGIKTVSKSR